MYFNFSREFTVGYSYQLLQNRGEEITDLNKSFFVVVKMEQSARNKTSKTIKTCNKCKTQ